MTEPLKSASDLRADAFRAGYPDLADLWDERVECWQVAELPNGWVVQVMPMLYTAALVVARPGGLVYEDRWCYHTVPAAVAAARAWPGPYPGSEPTGWHRHPSTGRRRNGGDPTTEYVQP